MNDMITLIEPLIPALRRYARSLMKERSAGDDLVQDCLERAISRWYQRRPDGNARTWLFTILHNLAVNRLRQQSRHGQSIPIEDAADAVFAVAASQEDGLHRRDIAAALDALPEEQRTVLLLISVEDLSYGEAARVLDIPIGTVMSRLSRARERLLKIMESDQVSMPMLRRVK
jgi:RNA polymerase sigma factor (sigma-70 family)